MSIRRLKLTVQAAAAMVAFTAVSAMAAPDDEWDDWGDDWDEPEGGLVWTGFAEGGIGTRYDAPDEPENLTLGDLRFRAETEWTGEQLRIAFKGDALYDGVTDDFDAELRELTGSFQLGASTDVALGQQVLTWGTGDLLFLNDLFPKDFQSFFAGRDDEYLKAPSASLRLTNYNDVVNIDAVWTPLFEPDKYLTGERFSFYLPPLGGIGVPVPPLSADKPDKDPGNGEFALRLFNRSGAAEYAVYGYRGFHKQPVGQDDAGLLYFPKLSVYGASLRRPAGSGVLNTEVAWYDSREDRAGTNPGVPNSQARGLLGYERELVRNWQIGVQGYAEWNAHNDRARAVDPATAPDEWRTVLTARLTGRLLRENLILSLFAFYSPSDQDAHLRPSATWRISDAWSFVGGANVFLGEETHTFFGQLEDNNNVYLRVTRHY